MRHRTSFMPLAARRNWGALTWGVLALVLLQLIIHPRSVSSDAASLLQFAKIWVEGGTPYIDFVDFNSPMVLYFHALPALAAHFFPIHIIFAFSLLVVLLMAGSVFTVRRVLRQSDLPYEEDEAEFALFALTALSAAPAFAYIFLFGQREYLFSLLFIPFLVLRWVRWEGGFVRHSTAVALGLAAGVGITFKPYFLVAFLAPEIYWLSTKRTLRHLLTAEIATLVTFGALFLAHLFLLPDPIIHSLFDRWLPFVSKGYYAFNEPLRGLLLKPHAVAAFVICIGGFFVPFLRGGIGGFVRPLAVFIGASVVIYLIQAKGWEYHLLPALLGAVMILGIGVYRGRDMVPWPVWAIAAVISGFVAGYRSPVYGLWGMTLFAALAYEGLAARYLQASQDTRWERAVRFLPYAAFLLTALVVLRQTGFTRDTEPFRADPLANVIVQHSKKGDPVLFVTTVVPPAYPLLLQMDRRPGARYLNSVQIAILYAGVPGDSAGSFPYRTRSDALPEERQFLDELTSDVLRIRPRLIFVPSKWVVYGSYGLPHEFITLAYLTHVGFIETAMRDYDELTTVESWAVFKRRHDGSRH